MDPTIQRNLVQTHIAGLEAEAAAERLARSARAPDPRPSVRAAVGRRLVALGTAIAPVAREEPCPDTGAGQPA
jgi:hypothetical protein